MAIKATAAAPAPANDTEIQTAAVDQDALGIKALARGVLARDFRPRASSVRRLAEEVLSKPKPKPKKPKEKKSASVKAAGKSSDKSSGSKNRKLAKIPGQKGKKKKMKG